MATLVIIRGNSGSGKTSLAKKLQEYYGRKTLLISQDIVRRDMLKEKVKPSNLSISLTETIARYGYERDLLVIVEGFYETDIYGQMLEKLHTLFYPKVLSYYYDLSFIGWYLLTAITLGIASIYVYPYVYTAQTLFYEAVLKEQDQTPIFY